MATQIVMDHTGHTRHCFNPNDAQALASAERAFYGVDRTWLYRGRPKWTGRDHQSAVIRSYGGRDSILPASGRRLIWLGDRCFGFDDLCWWGLLRVSTPYASCIGNLPTKIRGRLAACGFCETGSRLTSENNLITLAISRSSVAPAENDTGSTM